VDYLILGRDHEAATVSNERKPVFVLVVVVNAMYPRLFGFWEKP
jgi:hypothetical protein